MNKLDALAALAQKATPGPWTLDDRHWCQQAEDWDSQSYIAALDPQTVLALIECVRSADAMKCIYEKHDFLADSDYDALEAFVLARAKLEQS